MVFMDGISKHRQVQKCVQPGCLRIVPLPFADDVVQYLGSCSQVMGRWSRQFGVVSVVMWSLYWTTVLELTIYWSIYNTTHTYDLVTGTSCQNEVPPAAVLRGTQTSGGSMG